MRRFLIIGQTGVGKSSFVNAAFGIPVAQTFKFEACTKIIESYTYHSDFGNLCLIDTPGLSEDTHKTDKAYLHLLQQYVFQKSIDVVLYITRLNENRFRPDEKRALQLLTDYLGPTIWQQAWIVFTFADSVPKSQLEYATTSRNESISSFLYSLTEKDTFPFPGFRKIIRIDNIVPNWHDKAVPISSILLTFRRTRKKGSLRLSNPHSR